MSSSVIDKAIAELDSIILKLSESLKPISSSYGNGTDSNQIKIQNAQIQNTPQVSENQNLKKNESQNSQKNENQNSTPSPNSSTTMKEKKKEVVNGDELLLNFEKCLFQVGKILSVENHPVSEKLFICKVEIAPGEVKQVVAGLRKFFGIEELSGKSVCLICNLKTAKLAGQLSEAMILAGSTALPDGTETVKILKPPNKSLPGDKIYLKNGSVSEKIVKQLSSKIWDKIAHALSVQGGLATLNGIPLVTNKGEILVSDLPDGAEIH